MDIVNHEDYYPERSDNFEIKKPDFLSIGDLSVFYEKPWTWIVRRIAPFKGTLNLTQDIRHLNELKIPREVFLEIPYVPMTEQPAIDWMTVTEISRELEVEYTWVNRRILSLDAVGEWRICNQVNRPEFHLPPDSLEQLLEIKNSALTEIDTDNYLNLSDISDRVGRHRLWVLNRLEGILNNIDGFPVLALNSNGKAVEYYPIQVLERLLEEKDKFLDSEDRVTIPMLVQATGRGRNWVESRLEEIGAPAEYRRFSVSGRVDLSFPAETITELTKIAKSYEKADGHWYTANSLMETIGKSYNWMGSRLEYFDNMARIIPDSQGVPRIQYPIEVLEELLDIAEGWKTVHNLRLEDEEYLRRINKRDSIFRKIYDMSATTISENTLLLLGATEGDIRQWIELGLLTRWNDGIYHYTKQAEVLMSIDLMRR